MVCLTVLEVTAVRALYFFAKTIKLTNDIHSHDKGGLKYPKNDINSFLTKYDVKGFCLCTAEMSPSLETAYIIELTAL